MIIPGNAGTYELRIDELLEEEGKNRVWLAKQYGATPSFVGHLVNNNTTRIDFNTLAKLTQIFHVEIQDLFRIVPKQR